MESMEGSLRCPHCLEELSYLEDPKQLPCSHIFCMPCLESITTIIDTAVEFTCSTCSDHHQLFNLSWLPQGKLPVQTDAKVDDDAEDHTAEQPETSAQIYCDKCKAEDKVAVSFCVDCNTSLCCHHEHVHQDFFDDEDDMKHQILSIQVYMSKPNFYKRDRCATHKKEFYAVCCEKCYKLACLKCTKSYCKAEEQGGHTRHDYLTLEQTSIKLKSEFEALIKKCSDKITEMCKVEKETWLKLDKFEDESQKLVNQVETKAEKLIETIEMELDRVRGRIRAHEKEGKDRIERYLQELREERERLVDMKAENSHFLLQNNVVEILQNRKGRVKQLEDATSTCDFDTSDPDTKMVKKALSSFMELNIHVIPQHLELLASYETGGGCYAAHFNQDGQLLIGSHDGIRIYTSDLKHEKTLEAKHVTAIASLREERVCYFVVHTVDERTVGKTSPDFSNWQKVFTYKYPGNEASRLAVSSEFLVGTAYESVVIHNKSTETTTVQKLSFDPEALCFDSYNNLLITTSDELKKFKFVGEGNLTLIWTCSDLKAAGGIALTRYGDIVMKSCREKKLHIISPRGELLQTMTHEALTGKISSIDIHGDILIEPCWDGNKFNRYLMS